MTQEQFNKVREIVREIDSLEYTKEKINEAKTISYPSKQKIGLKFCRRCDNGLGWEVINTTAFTPILRKYEELIRQEIDDQINELKKNIEEL